MGQIVVKEGERIDDLERNGYKIIQNPKMFCFGMDAVLLSGWAKVNEGEKVIDLGSGNGIIPILLEAKTEGQSFTGLEIIDENVDMASRSIILNGQQDKVRVVKGDIKEASKIFGKASVEVVTSNPPYMGSESGLKNPAGAKAIARHEILCNLDDVIREGTYLLKPGGRFYMVHRPHRLTEIIDIMRSYKLEPKRIRMIHPDINSEANMVLIEGVRGGKSFLKVEPPLIVYKDPGKYSDEIYRIYGF